MTTVAALAARVYAGRRDRYLTIFVAVVAASVTTVVLTTEVSYARAEDVGIDRLWPCTLATLAAVLLGLGWSFRRTASGEGALLAWLHAPDPAIAVEVWERASSLSWRLVRIFVPRVLLMVMPAWTVSSALRIDGSAGGIAISVVGTLASALYVTALARMTAVVMLQPVLTEVDQHLPNGFSPVCGERLGRELASHLFVFTVLAGGAVAAFSSPGASGPAPLTRGFAVAAAGGLTIVLPVSALLTERILAPVRALRRGTAAVGASDFTTRVAVLSPDEYGRLAVGFNTMSAALDESTREIAASRTRLATAADDARRRLERNLHEGAEAELVQLDSQLAAFEGDVAAERSVTDLVAGIRDELREALGDLRELAQGIYPSALHDAGLPGALADAAARAAIATEVDCHTRTRFPRGVEAAVYFCCLEALQNAAKHAGPGATARVSVFDTPGALTFAVVDDGEGIDPRRLRASAGMQNMSDRIGAFGGTMTFDSAPGRGMTVTGTIPL